MKFIILTSLLVLGSIDQKWLAKKNENYPDNGNDSSMT